MDIDKLKTKVKKKIKSIEEKAFDKFCEDEIEHCLKRLRESKEHYDKELMYFRNITEKFLKERFESYSPKCQETYKDTYIKHIKGSK